MGNPYYYTVRCCYEGKEDTSAGFVYGETYGEAAEQVNDFYRGELISMTLEALEEYALFDLKPEEVNKFKQHIDSRTVW